MGCLIVSFLSPALVLTSAPGRLMALLAFSLRKGSAGLGWVGYPWRGGPSMAGRAGWPSHLLEPGGLDALARLGDIYTRNQEPRERMLGKQQSLRGISLLCVSA